MLTVAIALFFVVLLFLVQGKLAASRPPGCGSTGAGKHTCVTARPGNTCASALRSGLGGLFHPFYFGQMSCSSGSPVATNINRWLTPIGIDTVSTPSPIVY